MQSLNRSFLSADAKTERDAKDNLGYEKYQAHADHRGPFAGVKVAVIQEVCHLRVLTLQLIGNQKLARVNERFIGVRSCIARYAVRAGNIAILEKIDGLRRQGN